MHELIKKNVSHNIKTISLSHRIPTNNTVYTFYHGIRIFINIKIY
jgi:hypothetical protein